MAISIETKTLLPLDRFAQLTGIHPLHFNGVYHNDLAPTAQTCGMPILQYTWQTADAISREELAIAINDAENDIASLAKFKLAPTWEIDERVNTHRPYPPELFSSYKDVRGFWQSVKLKNKHLISGGIEAKSLLSASAAVAYSDADGDGYNELATITIAVAANLEEEQVAVYYPGQAGAGEYEIRPIKVVISGGVATITCRREQLVILNLLTRLYNAGGAVDAEVNANFLTTVDVYRHFNDPQLQTQFMWREPCGSCADTGCGDCTYEIQTGCSVITDYELGWISNHPAQWNIATQEFDAEEFTICRQPDRLRLWYYSGYRDMARPTQMARKWEIAVTRLALARLDRPICGCANIQHVVDYWSTDMAYSVSTPAKSERMAPIQNTLKTCPFGTTRGALFAYEQVINEAWR